MKWTLKYFGPCLDEHLVIIEWKDVAEFHRDWRRSGVEWTLYLGR